MAIERDKKEKVTPEPKEETATDKLLQKIEAMEKELTRLQGVPTAKVEPVAAVFDIDAIALKTKEALASEDKIDYFVPPDPYATGDQYQEVWLNGFKYQLLKGQSYKLPKSIYEIITESITKTMKAQNKIKDAVEPFATY